MAADRVGQVVGHGGDIGIAFLDPLSKARQVECDAGCAIEMAAHQLPFPVAGTQSVEKDKGGLNHAAGFLESPCWTPHGTVRSGQMPLNKN